jgi:tetratricopeptide (TPR) repeat protein
LVYQRGTPPQATYLFKHALIQDTAYQSLLKSRRQQLHQQIAHVLEERFPDTKDTQPELLAHHYTEAGLISQAVPYWQQAGQNASQRSAYQEAINHLAKGIEVLKLFPDTPERARQEISLQLTLGPALIATKGWAAPEVEDAYIRARELCQREGETSQLFPVLWGLWVFYYVREELRKAHELAEQLLALAQGAKDPTLLMEAHMALGTILHPLGEFISARKHLEQSIALYDPQRHRPLAFLYGGADAGMRGLTQIAWTLWMLGYPNQALERMRSGITLAQDLSQPHSLAFALCFAAELHQFRREARNVQERAEEALRLSAEQGLPF